MSSDDFKNIKMVKDRHGQGVIPPFALRKSMLLTLEEFLVWKKIVKSDI